ncbi:NADH-quinone oxidoreductase subunit I [bacterium]|nr:NADH-quinone oxidoreductase subunit I [bacterium]
MAVSVKNITVPRGKNWVDNTYIIPVIKGLIITLRHMFKKPIVLYYPENKKVLPPNYRGLHMLTRDEQGREKCVACEMCSTACPADCIRIVANDSGDVWKDNFENREKHPIVFEIDELRCIFCGMCVEACPEDAIDMTDMHNLADYTRQDFIYDKERLLGVYDEYIKRHPDHAKRRDGEFKAMKNSSYFSVVSVENAKKPGGH